MKPYGSRLLWVLNYKLGSLHLPGDNGELLEVYVVRNKVIRYLLYFVQSIIKYPVENFWIHLNLNTLAVR